MGEMTSFWGYEQDMEQQLGQKLLYTTLELEKLKEEAVDEMSKNKEHIKQLINMLKYAVQERDEARNQLHKLLNNAGPSLPANPLFLAAAAPSGITECNSASEAYNYRSHSTSPVNSLSGLPCVGLVANQALVQDPDAFFPNNHANSGVMLQSFDQGSLIIDGILKGRVLPEKGKFLQAVAKAGPLLQTLLVAGPLPRWRNPPQIQQLQMPPPVCDSVLFSQKPAMNVGHMASKSFNLQPHGQISCGTAQVQAAPLFNFSNLGGGGGLGSGMNCSDYDSLAKRRRLI